MVTMWRWNPKISLQIHTYAGAELVFVLQGELVINVAGEDHTLRRGDAIYFDCANPHTYRRNGRSRCAAIVVVTGYDSRRSEEVADPAHRSTDERRIAN